MHVILSDLVRNFYTSKSETSRKGVFIVADLPQMNQTEQPCMASETLLKPQTLSVTRFAFTDCVSAYKQCSVVALAGIFTECAVPSRAFIKTSLELPRRHSTPEEIAVLDLSKLAECPEPHSRGCIGHGHAARIQELAMSTFGIGLATDAFALELQPILKQTEFAGSHSSMCPTLQSRAQHLLRGQGTAAKH